MQFSEAARDGIMEDTQIKVFVVDKTKGGKTSLSKAIVAGEEYHEDPQRTVVLDVQKPVEMGKNVKIQLYDAGGHLEYYLITTLFLHTTDCIFIIVLDGTKYSNVHFQVYGVYLNIAKYTISYSWGQWHIVPNCKKGYILIAVSKSDDKEFKFKESDINIT